MKRILLAGAAALAVAFPATAQKTTLTVGMAAQDIGRIDPHLAPTTIDKVVVGWMFNGLVRFKPGSINPAEIEPDLAERWESSADGRTWTFHLRRGVQFQQGFGELTADDVVASLKKAATAGQSAFVADFRAFETIEAVDPYTLRIVLKETVPSLLGIVTNYHGGNIVSRRAVAERGEAFARNPVGTGPFQVASHTPNQSLELSAHAGYFRGAPALQRISYRFIPSSSSRDLAFQAGEIDLNYSQADQTWVRRMRGLSGVVVDVFEPGELAIIDLDTSKAPLNDIRVRQAIAHAVNREQLVQWRGAEISRVGVSVVPVGYLGTHPSPGLLPHNVDRAKALLAEAGFPQGLTIKIVHTQLPEMLNAMQVVQQQLRRAGITLDIETTEHGAWHQRIRRSESPVVYYAAARFPVADVYLSQFYHSRSQVGSPTAVTNFTNCNQADSEIDAARTETDAAKQIALWRTAQEKIVANVCAVPLFETLLVWARRDTLDWGYELKGSMSLGPLVTERTRFTR
jgi:peptide/nickel transport system substrate-binding protein